MTAGGEIGENFLPVKVSTYIMVHVYIKFMDVSSGNSVHVHPIVSGTCMLTFVDGEREKITSE